MKEIEKALSIEIPILSVENSITNPTIHCIKKTPPKLNKFAEVKTLPNILLSNNFL